MLIAGLVSVSSGASAIEVTVTPGGLAGKMPKICGTVDNQLILRGKADVTDLRLLENIPATITTLDMSGLEIVAYTYTGDNYMGRVEFTAGEIPPHLLSGTKITSVKLPAGAVRLAEKALAVSELTEVEIPASVTELGDYALAGNRNLRKVVIKGTPAYGKGVFREDVALNALETAEPIMKVTEGMFSGCKSLTAMPLGVTKVGDNAFRGSGLQQLDLSGVSKAGDYAFADCTDLCQIVFGSETIELGTGIFFGDSGIAELPAWQGNVPVLMAAHSSAYMLNAVNAPVIGEAAFANDRSFTSLALGRDVREIKADAFRNALGLKKINATQLGGNVPEVSPSAFQGLENASGRYDIPLTVQYDEIEKWTQHPVWGLFDLQGDSTNVMELPGAGGIEISRSSNVVRIATAEHIVTAEVYDLKGIKIFEGGRGFDRLDIDVPAGEIVVVRVRTTDNNTKIAKLR